MLLNSLSYTNDWQILQENATGGDYPRLILSGKLQEALTPNNNRRKYKLETLQEKIINARCTKEMLESDPLFGENIHPDDKLTGEINSEKVIWKILEARMDGNIMTGAVEIIPELPLGKTMYFLIEKYGAKPGISSRGFGAMDGDWVDHDSYKFVTFDGTFNPSTHGAFLKKLGESNEMKEFIKSFEGKDIQCLSESSMLRLDNGKSIVDSVLNKSYHIINQKDMSKELELLQEANRQVANLSVSLSESNSSLTEAKKSMKEMEDELAAKDKQISEMEDEMKEYKAKMEKSKKESEEAEAEKEKMEEENSELAKDKEALEENYSKALKVAEGMTEKYHEVNGFYGKSIQVLELMESSTTERSVSSLVEKELGEGAFEQFSNIFEGKSLKESAIIVESLKKIQSGNNGSPTRRVSLTERNLDDNGNPISESSNQSHDEGRISAYDL